jgi:hypothetical protein
MSDPRYRPRDWAVEPALFGVGMDIKWGDDVNVQSDFAQRGASALQHDVAVSVRNRLRDRPRRMSLKRLAAETEISYDRLSRLLRGEVVMRLEDIAAMEAVLGALVTRL